MTLYKFGVIPGLFALAFSVSVAAQTPQTPPPGESKETKPSPAPAEAKTPETKPATETAPPPPKPATPATADDFRRLVKQARGGDLTIDFSQLRRAYLAFLKEGKFSGDSKNWDNMVEAFKKDEHAKAIELAQAELDDEFTNVTLHRGLEKAYRALNNAEKAEYHKTVAGKLIEGLLKSADGLTPETAYVVTSIPEEYFIMRQLGYQVGSQALILGKNGKPYDLLSGVDKKTDKPVSIYFDISFFFGK